MESTGRRPKEQKREMVASEYDVSHADADPKQRVFRREQFAWRIIDGQAVYVGYRIQDLPDSKQLPLPPGLRTSRSKYGIEIILILAFLHYWIGISLDHACEVLRFFTKLELSKSQADSLLSQLAADWDEPYDTIAELIALRHPEVDATNNRSERNARREAEIRKAARTPRRSERRNGPARLRIV